MDVDGVQGSDRELLDRQSLDTDALCCLVSERHHALVDLECEMLELAALWADHYSTLPDSDADDPVVVVVVVAGAEKRKLLGGEGTPLIWARVRAGEVRAWQACKVAEATRGF